MNLPKKNKESIVALNQKGCLFRVNSERVDSVETCDLTFEEKVITGLTQIEFYRKPFDAVLVVVEDKIKNRMQIKPEVFYPLTPLDYVAGIEAYVKDCFALPVNVFLNPTNRCNYACEVCFAKDEKTFSDIPFEAYLDTMKFLRSRNSVLAQTISGGGDPSLYPDILKILQFAGKNEICTFLTTNGSRNDGAFFEALVENLSIACFSIQGINNESYQRIMHPPKQVTLENILLKIELVVKERDKKGRRRQMLVGVTSLVHPANTGSYERFSERLYNIGVDYLHFNPILPSLAAHRLSFTSEQAKTTKEEFSRLKESYKNKLFLRVATPLFKEKETFYYNPNTRLNQDICLVSLLQPHIMPISKTQNCAALVACRYQPNITTNENYLYSPELGTKSFSDIWTPENVARINYNAKSCDSCSSGSQLRALDWMLQMKKEYPKSEFLLGFEL